MPITVTLPSLGASAPGGTVARWCVAEGTTVRSGDLLLELDTDSVRTEIPSSTTGVLLAKLVAVEQPIVCGDPIAVIDAGTP